MYLCVCSWNDIDIKVDEYNDNFYVSMCCVNYLGQKTLSHSRASMFPQRSDAVQH